MRNSVDPQDLHRIGNIPQSLRDDLRHVVEAWYVAEQQKLTDQLDDRQLRQAQGAAQVLRELSAVLKDPTTCAQSPVPAPRSTQGFP